MRVPSTPCTVSYWTGPTLQRLTGPAGMSVSLESDSNKLSQGQTTAGLPVLLAVGRIWSQREERPLGTGQSTAMPGVQAGVCIPTTDTCQASQMSMLWSQGRASISVYGGKQSEMMASIHLWPPHACVYRLNMHIHTLLYTHPQGGGPRFGPG